MSDKFDQLAKGLAQSATRRQALKHFGFGLVGMALAGFGLSSKAASHCGTPGQPCGQPGQGGCGSCCSHSHFCEIESDVGRRCFCN